MKTNKKVWKLVGVVLALAMVVGCCRAVFLVSLNVDATVYPTCDDEYTSTVTTASDVWFTEDFENWDELNSDFVGSTTDVTSSSIFWHANSESQASDLETGEWMVRIAGSSAYKYANYFSVELSDEWDADGAEGGHSIKFIPSSTVTSNAYHDVLITAIDEDQLSDEVKALLDVQGTAEELGDDGTGTYVLGTYSADTSYTSADEETIVIAHAEVTMEYDWRGEETSTTYSASQHATAGFLFSGGYNIDSTTSTTTSYWVTGAPTTTTYHNTMPYVTSYSTYPSFVATKLPAYKSLINTYNGPTTNTAWYVNSYNSIYDDSTYGSSKSTANATKAQAACKEYKELLNECAKNGSINYTGATEDNDYTNYGGVTVSYLAEEDTDDDGTVDTMIGEGHKTGTAQLYRTEDGRYYIGIDTIYLTQYSTLYFDNIKVSIEVEQSVDAYTQHAHLTYSDQTDWVNVITPYTQEAIDAVAEEENALYSESLYSSLHSSYNSDDYYDIGSFENAGDWSMAISWGGGGDTTASWNASTNAWYSSSSYSGTTMAHWGNSPGSGATAYYTTYVYNAVAGDYQTNVRSLCLSGIELYAVAKLSDENIEAMGYETTDEGYAILGQLGIGSTTTSGSSASLKYGSNTTDFEDGEVVFELTEDYTNLEFGYYVINSSSSSWGCIDDAYLLGPTGASATMPIDDSYLDDQSEWYNIVTPYSDSVLEQAVTDGVISSTTYSKSVDAALVKDMAGCVDSDYDDGSSTSYSVGSFEKSTYWKKAGTHTGQYSTSTDISSNQYYTGYSGSSVASWGYSDEDDTLLFYTTVDAMAKGWYETNVKAVGASATMYIVADLDGYTNDGEYELTDDGYTILGTLNRKGDIANAATVTVYDENGNEVEATDGTDTWTVTASPLAYFSVAGTSNGNVVFYLDKDYTNVNIGVYIVENSNESWGYLDDFFLIGPDNSGVFVPIVYDIDDLSNGDFESGLDYNWTVEEYGGSDVKVEITEDQYEELSDYNVWEENDSYYIWLAGGYTIDYTGRDGYTSTTVECDNSAAKYEAIGETPENYVLTLSRIVQMTEEGNYKIKVDTMGRWSDETDETDETDEESEPEFYITVSEYNYDPDEKIKEEGDEIFEYSVPTTGEFGTFTENISEENFYVEEGSYIVVRVYVDLDGKSDYGDGDDSLVFDNIHIVSEDYEGDGYDSLHGTNQFADAFTTYYLSTYWTFDTNNKDDMSTGDNGVLYYGDYYYGYTFGWDDSRDSDEYYFKSYVNTSDTFTYTLTQYIDFTKSVTYTLTADVWGSFYGDDDGLTVTAYEVDEDGSVSSDAYWTGTVSASDISSDEDNVTIGDSITVESGTTLMFVITGTVTGGGSEADQGYLNIDYVTLSISAPRDAVTDDYGYKGVVYAAEDGVRLVNGGTLIKGVDISSIISIEESGVTFTDDDGNEADIFTVLADAGVNYIRVRVFNDPYSRDTDTYGATYGGGHNDVATAVAIAQRAARAGLSLYIDFQCSDFWADPDRQLCPKAWADYDVDAKAEALAEFIDESLTAIQATGVSIGIVSIGNEIVTWDDETETYVFMGESGSNYATLLSAGADAVRAFDSNILIALHIAPSGGGYVSYMASQFEKVDYDVFATSFYPYLTSHSADGTMDTVISELNSVAAAYGKMTMIAEYNWPFTQSDDGLDGYDSGVVTNTDQFAYETAKYCILNSSAYIYSSGTDYSAVMQTLYDKGYVTSASGGVSEETQYNVIADMVEQTATNITDCIGSFYWEAAWVDVKDTAYTVNDVTYSSRAEKWYAFGSGLSTKAGAGYVEFGSDDAGSAADTYALFQTKEMTSDDGYSTNVVAFLNSFTSGDSTEYAVNAFGSNGSDGNMPIDIALAQVQTIKVEGEDADETEEASDSDDTGDSDGTDDTEETVVYDTSYSFRLVGRLNRDIDDDPVEDVGFRVFLYDASGNVLGSSYFDKMTTTLYNKITANGYTVKPSDTSENDKYFYTYKYTGIPIGKVYYFEVMSNSDDIEYCAYYQKASKVYAVYNGHAAVVRVDDIGTLSGNDVIDLEAEATKGATDNTYGTKSDNGTSDDGTSDDGTSDDGTSDGE